MSTDRDTTRIVRSWLRTEENESADRVLGTVLDRLDTTPQRPATWWPARRYPVMNFTARIVAAAAAIAVAAFLGYSYLVAPNTGAPSVDQSPAARVLASGSFSTMLTDRRSEFDVAVTGTPDDASGQVILTLRTSEATIDIECSKRLGNGAVALGGIVTDFTPDPTNGGYEIIVGRGERLALILQPGTPVQAGLWLTEDAANCSALLDEIDEDDLYLRATNGDLELNP